jgi:thioredoxin reductase (NADPH)
VKTIVFTRPNPTVEVRYETEVTKLEGDNILRRIEITNRQEGKVERIDTSKLFVCIGGKPNTEWAKDTEIVRDGRVYCHGSRSARSGPPA